MGRHLPRELSALGWRIYDRVRALGLDPAEVAAAAGISPSTLYRMMRADRRGTADPRMTTKRRIARALRISMVTLFDDEQLELEDQPVAPKVARDHAMELLPMRHLRSVSEGSRSEAGRAAAFALVDLVTTVGARKPPELIMPGTTALAEDSIENLLLILLYSLPKKLRRTGAQAAIRAMLNVQQRDGGEPSKAAYAAVLRTNWSSKRRANDLNRTVTLG